MRRDSNRRLTPTSSDRLSRGPSTAARERPSASKRSLGPSSRITSGVSLAYPETMAFNPGPASYAWQPSSSFLFPAVRCSKECFAIYKRGRSVRDRRCEPRRQARHHLHTIKARTVHVALLGKGDGTFTEKVPTTAIRAQEAVKLGDVNGDGYLDLVTAIPGDLDNDGNAISYGKVTVLPGRCERRFPSDIFGQHWCRQCFSCTGRCERGRAA